MSTLLVTGAGSLAQAMLQDLSRSPGPIDTVAIAARETDRLHWIARAVRARGTFARHPVNVRAEAIDWGDPGSLASLLDRTQPRVVLHTASWQSPWSLAGSDRWSALVRRIGYGLTLPLHLILATRIARAVAEYAPSARFVNACFPDVVNPMLARARIPVTCGIGNVAILATMLSAELHASTRRLRLIAHHTHVASAISGRPPPVPVRARRDDESLDAEVASWLATARLPGDARLNMIASAAAVPLLHALVDHSLAYEGHAPGPNGLCGGYPIAIRGGTVALDLPNDMSLEEAGAHNRAASIGDGLLVDADGRVGWSPQASSIVNDSEPLIRDVLRDVFITTDVEEGARRLCELRDRLVLERQADQDRRPD